MRILSATDFLPKSEAAVERAGFLADSLVAELTIAHAVPPGVSDRRTLEQRASRATLRLSTRISPPNWQWESRPEFIVQCGHPARMVLDTAHRLKVGLVVLGPHGNSTFVDAVSGTITEKVLGAAACPVLIAHQEMQGPYRQVLVALDGAPSADGIVHAVESLGLTRESLATVVHAHEPPYVGLMNIVGVGGIDAAAAYADTSRAQAANNIRNLLGTYSDDSSLYEVVVVEHRPATAILGIVDRLKPDLLVLGTRGHGRFRRALLGSVASEVMSAVHCDVLLVPERVSRVSRAVRGAVAHAAT